MKDERTTLEIVAYIASQELGYDVRKITPATSFSDDIGADSLDLVELAMTLEDHFDIDLSDSEVLQLKTIQDAVDLIERKLKDGGA